MRKGKSSMQHLQILKDSTSQMQYLKVRAQYEKPLPDYKFTHACMIPDCHSSMHLIQRKNIKVGNMCYLICNNCRTSLYAVLRRVEKYGVSISNSIIQE